MSELRDKLNKVVYQEILDGVLHGREFAEQDIDYPVDARTHIAVNELEQLVNQEVLKALDSVNSNIGEIPSDEEILKYNGELRGKWSERKLVKSKIDDVRANYTQEASK